MSNDGNVTVSYALYQTSYPSSQAAPTPSRLSWTVHTIWEVPVIDPVSEILEVPVLGQSISYAYAVVALNNGGFGPFSSVAVAKLPGVILRPSIIGADLLLDISSSSALLRWNGDIAATEYRVDYKLANEEEWETITAIPGDRGAGNVVVNGLRNGETYTFQVTGTAEGISGPTSLEYTQVIGTRPLDSPLDLTPTVSVGNDGVATVSWPTAAFNGLPTTYNLFINQIDAKTFETLGTETVVSGISSTTYSTTLSPGSGMNLFLLHSPPLLTITTVFYFVVQAQNALGSGSKSVESLPSYYDLGIPAPSGIDISDAVLVEGATSSSVNVDIAWNKISGFVVNNYIVCPLTTF